MNDIPIIGKILTVLAIVGVFVIGVAAFATSQLSSINSRYHT